MIKDLVAGMQAALAPSRVVTKDSPLSASVGGQFLNLESSTSFQAGGKELINAYGTNPNLKRVAQIVAQSLASTPFYLRKKNARGGKSKHWSASVRSSLCRAHRVKAAKDNSDEVYEHPALDFLYRGSPVLNGPSSLVLSYLYRLIKGEFFWEFIASETGKLPQWYMVIPPQWVASVPHGDKDWYQIRTTGKERRVGSESMLWAKDADLIDPYGRGRGIGDSLADEIDSDEYASALLRYTLANRGFSDVIIGIKQGGGLEAESTAELVEAKYNQRHRGFYNSGRAVVIDTDKLEVKPITHSLSELRLLELREFERKLIAETFGVPQEILGNTSQSNRATITNVETIFAKYVQVPRLEAMRIDLQYHLLPLFDPRGEYLIEYESPIPADRDYELDVMRANPAAFTLNEYRVRAGEAEVPWGNVRNVPFNVMEIPIVGKSGGKSAQLDHHGEPPFGPSRTKGPAIVKEGAAISAAEIDRLLAEIDSSELVDKLGPTWTSNMEQIALAEWANLGWGEGSLTLVNPLIADHLKEFGGRWIDAGGIDSTTRELLGRSLAQGVDAGEGISELAKRVRGTMGDVADGYRSRLIARTETVRSANLGRKISWDVTGLPLHKRYISALVPETRESHAALHDRAIPLAELWTYDAGLQPGVADSIDMPGNSSFPAHSCNCIIPGQHVDGEILAGVRSQYSGGIVTINTLKGHKLTVTPNHPILTTRGFVAANLLRQGDDLLSYSPEIWASIAANGINQNPSVIEEIFASLAKTGKSRRRWLATNDLHGDASGVVGQVDVVSMDRDLPIKTKTGLPQLLSQFLLEPAWCATTGLSPSQHPGFVVRFASCFPGLAKILFDGGSVSTSSVIPSSALCVGIGSQWHASFSKPPSDDGPRNAEFFAELENGSPSFVSRDKVIHIDSGFYTGHVYDLQSRAGWIVTQGIAISNCLCTSTAFDPSHASASASIEYGSDAHQKLARAFADEVKSWEDYLLSEMKPFYTKTADRILDKLSKM